MYDLRRAFNDLACVYAPAEAATDPLPEWMTAHDVAEYLKVSEHHVYKTIARICPPINVGKSDRQPSYRFNRTQLIAALAGRRSR